MTSDVAADLEDKPFKGAPTSCAEYRRLDGRVFASVAQY